MPSIFLSASVPDPSRNPRYHESVDKVAVRDAVRALATVVIPKYELVWGGHPAITPLIATVLTSLSPQFAENVTLYQSEYFAKLFPEENDLFTRVVRVPAVRNDREQSLRAMREAMLNSRRFSAGIFIGGMEGVEQEYELFRELQPQARILPIASSGAAALFIYQRHAEELPRELQTDLAFPSLFRKLLAP